MVQRYCHATINIISSGHFQYRARTHNHTLFKVKGRSLKLLNNNTVSLACMALYNLSLVAENKGKISKLGAKEQVRRAMAAANAADETKKLGQLLLDKLAQC